MQAIDLFEMWSRQLNTASLLDDLREEVDALVQLERAEEQTTLDKAAIHFLPPAIAFAGASLIADCIQAAGHFKKGNSFGLDIWLFTVVVAAVLVSILYVGARVWLRRFSARA